MKEPHLKQYHATWCSLNNLLDPCMFFCICSSDKAKCFEVTKKLVEIFKSEKNYLQVWSLNMISRTWCYNRRFQRIELHWKIYTLFLKSPSGLIRHMFATPPTGDQSVAEVNPDEGGRGRGGGFRAAGAVEGDDQTPARHCWGSGQWDSAARQSDSPVLVLKCFFWEFWSALFLYIPQVNVNTYIFTKVTVFFFSQQLISAFERALQMTVDVPSEAHMSLSQDYIKCLSKVGNLYMPQL